MFHFDIIAAYLGDAAREALTMIPEGYPFQSEFGSQRFAEGRIDGEVALLRNQPTRKFGPLSPDNEARLRTRPFGRHAGRALRLSNRQAVMITSVGELFEGGPDWASSTGEG